MKIKDLEYLNNFYFEPTQTVYEKVGKLEEEFKEVIETHEESLKGKKSNSDVAQEVLDTIHAGINLLKKMNEEKLITIETEIFKHSVKLGEYLESGKYSVERESEYDVCKDCDFKEEELQLLKEGHPPCYMSDYIKCNKIKKGEC